jgi:F-type H+-transporting ATPase subunit delta
MDVTKTAQAADALRVEITRFEDARRLSPELQEVFRNPGISSDAKKQIASTIGEKLQLSELAMKLIQLLVSSHRINDLGGIIEALTASINAANGVVVADVRTAHPLDANEQQQLQRTLEQKFAKRVEIRLTTDPTLLGGFVAQVGSAIYDASVSGKIERFRESLA